MPRENLDGLYSLPAAAAISEGAPLVVNTSGQWAVAGAGVAPHGHAHHDAAQGDMLRAVTGRVVRGLAHGTIAVGDKLTPDGTGWIKGVTTGNLLTAVALGATTTGKHFECLLTGNIGAVP